MTMTKVINFALFQVGWFACILSAAAGKPAIGAVIASLIIVWHIMQAHRPSREISLILIAMLIGAIWDSLLVWQSWLTYPSGVLLPNTAPYWIIMLWALFASTLNLSLSWLKQNKWLSILLGAIAGPLAYYAGERLGAVDFLQPVHALAALAIGWAVLTPALLLLTRYFDGYALTTVRSGR